MTFSVAEVEIGFVLTCDDSLSHARSHTRTDKNCESVFLNNFEFLFFALEVREGDVGAQGE